MGILEIQKDDFVKRFCEIDDFTLLSLKDPSCKNAECLLVIPPITPDKKIGVGSKIKEDLISLYQEKQYEEQKNSFQNYLGQNIKSEENIYFTQTILLSKTEPPIYSYIGLNECVNSNNIIAFCKKINQWINQSVEN